MKNVFFVLLLISTVVFGQQNDKKWEKVRAFENEGKIKSANEIVTKIYKKAIARKDEPQMIKCFFYQSKYTQVLDENAKAKIVGNLKTDINRASIPSKAILNLIYAKYLKDFSNDYDGYSVVEVDSVAVMVDSAAALIDEVAATIDTGSVTGIKTPEIDSIEVPHSNYVPQEFTTEYDVINTFNKTLENEAILKATSLMKYKDIFDFPDLEKFKEENLWNYLLKENITFFTEKIQPWKIQNSDFLAHKEQLLGNSNAFLKLNLDFVQEPNVKKFWSFIKN
ncbi:hypothetical protein [Flavobacterium sp. N2038]|uniref:hypothetical protein n=1 Tax=Flavobacterium sp. N2038 TaxID=2986829 RepID=UPI0022255F8A|nr:hypothetical protein [Flavobacterium sp. N2038]